jgi:hypothetical protein
VLGYTGCFTANLHKRYAGSKIFPACLGAAKKTVVIETLAKAIIELDLHMAPSY